MLIQLQQLRLQHSTALSKKDYERLMARLNKDYSKVPLQSELDSIAKIIMAKLAGDPQPVSAERGNTLATDETRKDLFLTLLDEE